MPGAWQRNSHCLFQQRIRFDTRAANEESPGYKRVPWLQRIVVHACTAHFKLICFFFDTINDFQHWRRKLSIANFPIANGFLSFIFILQALDIVAARFTWNGLPKAKGSFFVGVSPEFDIAIYTACALTKPNAICSFTMAGNSLQIQTYDVAHKTGLQVATAYPNI